MCHSRSECVNSKGSMMPAAARGDATETVNTVHPASGDANTKDSIQCDVDPIITSTDACSGNVFVNGIGAVRQSDVVTAHPFPSTGCQTHTPGLVSFSGTVKINGLGAGRNGDTYGCGAIITSGSPNVSIGG